jgi:hypothetical protein
MCYIHCVFCMCMCVKKGKRNCDKMINFVISFVFVMYIIPIPYVLGNEGRDNAVVLFLTI